MLHSVQHWSLSTAMGAFKQGLTSHKAAQSPVQEHEV